MQIYGKTPLAPACVEATLIWLWVKTGYLNILLVKANMQEDSGYEGFSFRSQSQTEELRGSIKRQFNLFVEVGGWPPPRGGCAYMYLKKEKGTVGPSSRNTVNQNRLSDLCRMAWQIKT